MNKEVERIMHEVVNLEDAERAKLGRQALERLYHNLRKQDYHKDRIANIVINLTRMYVSADKDCAVKEYGFFKECSYPYSRMNEFKKKYHYKHIER